VVGSSKKANDMAHHFHVIDQPEFGAHAFKNLVELLAGKVVDLDLVWDTAKEGLITQLRRIKVTGKHHKQIERNLELFPSREIQKVNSPIERDNPTIQQRFGPHQLPTEVVHNQYPVVGLHLNRSGIQFADRIEMEIEHF